MPSHDLAVLHDTYAALQKAQLEREMVARIKERQAAGRVIDRTGRTPAEAVEIRCALGVGFDCQHCGEPFDAIKTRYLCPHCKTKNTCCE